MLGRLAILVGVLAIPGLIATGADTTNETPAQATPPSQPAPDPGPPSPFGIGGDFQRSRSPDSWIPQMAAIGIHVVRFANPDQRDYLTKQGFRFGGLLFGVPPGDMTDAPGSLPVKELQIWKDYVTQQVTDAKGRCDYWEVWNEPPTDIGPGQTAEDYAKLLVATYDAAKAADPSAKVAICAKSADIAWLERTILAGGKDHFDCVVLHPYEALGVAVNRPGTEPLFMNIVPAVRKMLAAQDAAKAGVPVLFTELGYDANPSPELQGCALVKAYTMGIAQGAGGIDWFEGADGDSGSMGLLDGDGKPRPAYTAMAQMIRHLGQHPVYLGWVLLNNKDYGFIFDGANGKVLVTWARKGTTSEIDFKKQVTVTDPLTGTATQADRTTLTENPIIVDGVPDGLVAQAVTNAGKPFPWRGDYSAASAVSVTYSRITLEKGLHTQTDSDAINNTSPGGGVRAGALTGRTVFMVDPNFLSYTQTPIAISVDVRRGEAGGDASFKLVYESADGYKDCGVYALPNDKEWHTMTWSIADEEFVGMEGYNFSLVSDSKALSNYDIRSVTVTK